MVRPLLIASLSAVVFAVMVSTALPAHAAVDWQADSVWTQLHLKGESAYKEKKYSRATGWLEQAVERAETFGLLDERLSTSLELLRQVYLDDRREEEADAITERLQRIAAARPESATERHERIRERITALHQAAQKAVADMQYEAADRSLTGALACSDSLSVHDLRTKSELVLLLARVRSEQGDPHAEATQTLGMALAINSVADPSKSLREFTESLDLSPIEFWDRLYNAGTEAFASANYDDAHELYRAATAQAFQLGPDEARVGRSFDGVGLVQWKTGDVTRAASLFHTALEMLDKARKVDEVYRADVLLHLGYLHKGFSNLPAADSALAQAIKPVKKAYGEKGDTTLGSLYVTLAEIASARGDGKEAEKYLREALKVDKKLMGESDPRVASTSYQLARHYAERLDYKKAEKQFAETLKFAEKAKDPSYRTYVEGFAAFLRSLSRDAEAEQLLQKLGSAGN